MAILYHAFPEVVKLFESLFESFTKEDGSVDFNHKPTLWDLTCGFGEASR